MSKKMGKKRRGGARDGAGRPRTGRHTHSMSFNANDEERAAILRWSKHKGVSRSMIIKSAVRLYFGMGS